MKKISTLLVLGACLSSVLFGINLHLNLRAWLLTWGQGLQLTVYAVEDSSDIEGLKTKIESLPFVAEVKIVTPEEALKEFQGQMASLGPSSLNAEELVQAIPPSLLVNLTRDPEGPKDLDRIKVIQAAVSQIKTLEGVESVDYGQAWVDQFSNIVHGLSFLWVALGVLLFVVAGSLIFNSIRVMIFERKAEVEILELLGADRFFIQRPFIQEGALLGCGGAILAVALNLVIFYLFKLQMMQNSALISLGAQLKNLDMSVSLSSLVAGTLIGALSAYFGVRKINSGWAAAESL
ncbi:MAG: hypothetical protein IPK04_05970 [Bdellovibrionales bacterium]|jgi:cell division transport system permease protein|nr:hypothetical protein [Bdellovibrionales bacterium]